MSFSIFILSIDPPIGTEHCDWLYGIFGHETSCTRYWTCWNGTATEQLCIGGLLYNENAHSCDWPENVEGCQKHRKYIVFLFISVNFWTRFILNNNNKYIINIFIDHLTLYKIRIHNLVKLVIRIR